MHTPVKALLIATLTLVLSACAGNQKPELSDNDRLLQALSAGELITKETDRGVVVYLPALFFDYGAASLKSEAQDKIRYIADTVNQDFANNRRIAVEGHTDANGGEEYNLELSQRRAESVADELIFSRVAAERIDIAWFGETVPIAPNFNQDGTDNPEGRARNRRVEFIILNP